MDSEYLETMFKFVLMQMTQTKVQSCQEFDLFAVEAVKTLFGDG